VQAALDAVLWDRTTVDIAHRFSTVRTAPRILVFDQGRIVENGTFDELVQQGGAFATLAKAQFLTAGPAERATEAAAEAADAPSKTPPAGAPTESPPVAAVEPPPNRITEDAAE
jgi:hypothetical protein